VGAGIAGAACARALRTAGAAVDVLDRGRRPGGRLASRHLSGRVVDLGAAYLTAQDPRFCAVVADWTRRGLARDWTDTFTTATPAGLGPARRGPLRHGAPAGLRSLVEDLVPDGVRSERTVVQVGPGPVVDGEPYDAVVLAMPDPQALRLLHPAEQAARAALTDRPWEPVLSVAAGWPERTWDLDGCFVNASPVLSFLADDGRRRGDGAPVLVAHSTAAHAARHLSDPSAGVRDVLDGVRALLDLPEPAWTAVQRWTYARPGRPHDEPYGLFDGVGVCGDGWGRPRVETAWLSGTLLGEALSLRA